MSTGGAPLTGLRIVITRAAHQSGPLAEAFRAAGARVELWPLLEVRPAAAETLTAARDACRSSDWTVLTSANAVRSLDALRDVPSASDGGPKLAVVGEATATALRRLGQEPDLIASRPRALGILEELTPRLRPGTRVVVPQADDARPELVRGLRGLGVEVEAFVVYTKSLPRAAREQYTRLFAEAPLGWVSFTSPRIVRHFLEVLGKDWSRRRAELRGLSIGPVTGAELRRQGIEPAAEALDPSAAGMVAAVAGALHSSE